MENSQDNSSIGQLEKRLYGSRPVPVSGEERAELSPATHDVRSSFGDSEDISTIANMKKEKDLQTPILKSLLTVASIFFLSALGIALYFYLGGSNIISSSNIDLSLTGPVSVKGGEDFTLQILISNKNNTPLKSAVLTVEYPEGAKIPKSDSVVPSKYIKNLGEIANNSVLNESVKSALFGEENGEQEINVTLEYRTEGSNATFMKKKTYKTFISSSPLSLTLDLPVDVSVGKDIDLDVKVSSNSSEVIKDVMLEAAYPSGFIFKSATPAPIYGDNLWSLGDLLSKGERAIKIHGTIQGQDGEIKTFRANVGTRKSLDDNKISLVYGSSLKSLVVKKPFIGINIALNGDTANSEYVADSNEVLQGEVSWVNNLPVKILNGELSVKINGETLDKASVGVGQGFFRSADGVIVWDKLNGSFPQSIEPGASGRENFSFSFLPLVTGRGSIYSNPQLDLTVTFKGTRFAEGSESGSTIEYTASRKIKLLSDLQLTARTLYYSGPFNNTGNLPPVVDGKTTYTIVWSVVNSSNDVKGVTVRASLPAYVEWLGNISPADEGITYNQLGREIVWSVGDISAGSGVTSKAREVAFQIAFTPSISQVGQYPILVSDATITGADVFTGEETSSVRRSLDIQLNTDSLIHAGDNGAVRQ